MDTIPEQLYLLQNQEQMGPFSPGAVREMLRLGTVSPTDYVWAEGMPEWVTVESLLGNPATESPGVGRPKRKRVGAKARPKSYGKFIVQALDYPFRGFGWATVLTGTLFFSGIEWFQRLPASPALLNLALSLGAWGYLLQMLQTIIHRTASGESDLPEWPEFDGFGELIGKCFQWLATVLVCAGPAVFISIKVASGTNEGDDPGVLAMILFWLAAVAGVAYFPMAALGVAMFDTIGALNPLLVARSIAKVPVHYLLTLLVFGVLLGVKTATVRFSVLIPIAGTLLDHCDSLWSSMFLARVLGGLYAINRDKLGWF